MKRLEEWAGGHGDAESGSLDGEEVGQRRQQGTIRSRAGLAGLVAVDSIAAEA